MKILVIGSGGREHALVWALSRSRSVTEIFSPANNAGILQLATKADVDGNNLAALADFAAREKIDLTVVGPEQPLVDGVADLFAARGLAVFGPSQAAARLEGSKIFSKEFMTRHRIPTARYRVIDDAATARAVVGSGEFSYPLVIKADGLAAGKGVVLAETHREAQQTIEDFMVGRSLGQAGTRLLIEECLTGRELSYLVFADGKNFSALPVAQDHKRVFDQDRGPNTGGMGAFSIPGLLDPATEQRIRFEIVEPTLAGAQADGFAFRGLLYCGLMLTDAGPQVLEYNVRFGDPETQAILRRMDSDLAEMMMAVAQGGLDRIRPQWSGDAATCVVMASGGYPGSYETGKEITGLSEAEEVENVVVFHAGTKLTPEGSIVTAGGRVLGVTARAATLQEATARAYEAVSRIHFDDAHYRRDIGGRSLHAQS
ncbi:MAG TPA: phosphoribosylamine--glycine ligase [Blastocatellia bacterium]|nr:phosphoribosylamine--glycine ligase [Blastocatellia bacterium]